MFVSVLLTDTGHWCMRVHAQMQTVVVRREVGAMLLPLHESPMRLLVRDTFVGVVSFCSKRFGGDVPRSQKHRLSVVGLAF